MTEEWTCPRPFAHPAHVYWFESADQWCVGTPGFAEAEVLAQRFHETRERLTAALWYPAITGAPVPWRHLPESERRLLITVCAEVLAAQRPDEETS